MAASHVLRQDPITKRWVACAPRRSARPKQTTFAEDEPSNAAEGPVEGCPFCVGHEAQLPQVIAQRAHPGDGPWATRTVPNKFPAFVPDASDPPAPNGFAARGGRGRQEVIIETPHHHQALATLPIAHVEAVVATYVARLRSVRASTDFVPFLFRNYGGAAGASLAHPHSQLIATALRPPQVEREEAMAGRHHRTIGECPYCAMLTSAYASEARVVYTNDKMAVFVPYAAHTPALLWIVPRTHQSVAHQMDTATQLALADALQRSLQALRRAFGAPAYNFYLRSALDGMARPHLHWSLRIVPRLSVNAGFERATGVHINPSVPEDDAAALRQAIA
ncbi:galactose-1-phosphate uridylyltransferase [Salisaeta longa]|uniref:galactose-1-phosphate uridylyltransferase n=1 Tax=Salisaeta longa TaxID=503170 RepID=UPI00068817AA|nr:DUF4931 domain-containing protein [Salisaeta longa]